MGYFQPVQSCPSVEILRSEIYRSESSRVKNNELTNTCQIFLPSFSSFFFLFTLFYSSSTFLSFIGLLFFLSLPSIIVFLSFFLSFFFCICYICSGIHRNHSAHVHSDIEISRFCLAMRGQYITSYIWCHELCNDENYIY